MHEEEALTPLGVEDDSSSSSSSFTLAEKLATHFQMHYIRASLFFRHACRCGRRAQRAAADRGLDFALQHPGEARPQRIGAAEAQVRPHVAADHRRGKLKWGEKAFSAARKGAKEAATIFHPSPPFYRTRKIKS